MVMTVLEKGTAKKEVVPRSSAQTQAAPLLRNKKAILSKDYEAICTVDILFHVSNGPCMLCPTTFNHFYNYIMWLEAVKHSYQLRLGPIIITIGHQIFFFFGAFASLLLIVLIL